MGSNRPSEKEIFNVARLMDSPEAVNAYLEQVCGSDRQIRARILQLLNNHVADSFLEESPATPEETVQLAQPQEREGETIGPYKLLQQIGEGGFGIVYMAEQQQPVRRKVALKVIKPGMDSKEVVGRFEAERQALALMDHPGIASVLDAGTTNSGHPFFVMELVQGIPVTDYCDREKLETADRLELFMKICLAVQHAHQKGVIHRDIKPSNVLVTEHDGTPVPKVIDFGVAKAINQRLTERTIFTRFQSMIGTPMYMSPEQADLSGIDVDTRTDVYSLGVLLYELLTGFTPFDKQHFRNASYDEIRRIIREDEPPKPSTRLSTLGTESSKVSGSRRTDVGKLMQSIRGELDWIVMKAVEKERGRRYETAVALADDLQRFLDDEPVVACPPSASYRLWKVARRYRAAIVTAAILLLSVVAGLIGTASQAVVATRALGKAESEQRKAEARRLDAERNSKLAQQHEREAREAQRVTRKNLYLMEMNFGGHAISQPGGVENVVNVLDRWRPRNEEDWRGWEWYYLNALCHQYIYSLDVQLEQREAPLATWSPDGSWIAARGSSSTIRVWNTSSREVAFTLPFDSPVVRIAWSPTSKHLMTTHTDQSIRSWSVASQQVDKQMRVEEGRLSAAVWNPRGTRIAFLDTQTEKWRIAIWDLATGDVVRPFPTEVEFLDGNRNWPMCLTWRSDEREIALGYWNGAIRLWDLDSRESTSPLPGHDFGINDIRYSPDGSSLASTSADGTVRIWDLETGGEQRLPGHRGFGLAVAWSPDGQWVASCGKDKTARIWDAVTGAETLKLGGHTSSVTGVSWSSDSSQVVTSGEDGAIRVWDAIKRRQPVTLEGHSRWVFCAAWSPDGTQLASSSGTMGSGVDDARVRLWDYSSGQARANKTLAGVADEVRYLCWHPDGVRVTSVSHDGRVNVWNTETGVSEDMPTEYKERRDSVAWSHNGERLAAGGLGYAEIWEILTDRHFKIGVGDGDIVWSVAWHPEGAILATAHHDGKVRLWDVDNPAQPTAVFEGHVESVRSIAWSPDGTQLASAGMDTDVRIWDVSDGSSKVLSRHASPVYSVCWSPDGTRLATGSFDHTVKVWDSVSGSLATSIDAHRDWVLCVSWSSDGQRIASASRDHTIRVWDAARGYQID